MRRRDLIAALGGAVAWPLEHLRNVCARARNWCRSRRRGCGLLHNEHSAVLANGQTQSLRSLFKGRVSRPLQQRMIGIVCRIDSLRPIDSVY